MARRARRALLAGAALLLCAALPAPAALAGPTFSVMNAEGGIYWRSAPDWNTPVRVSGFGVYNGEVIEPHCYQAGAGDVPGTSDYMWEYASDVTGPGYGTGWLNEHFINDGQPIDQPSPGVPPCNPPPPPAPSVGTGSASETRQTTTTLNATVNPNGANVTDCHFEYGPNESYGSIAGCTPAPGSGGAAVAVSAAVGGLTANMTYHFRIVATNAGGTGYGADTAVTTEPEPPTATTEPATAITQTAAQLNGSVNPNGASSECRFEYGPSASYGITVPCSNAPGAGTDPVAVTGEAAGLQPNTTYHYRIVAENAGGSTAGADREFTALGPPDFGRCTKVQPETTAGKPAYHGGFTSAKCTYPSPGHVGKYEWQPGDPQPGFTLALGKGAVVFQATSGAKITCHGANGTGSIRGIKEVEDVELAFTGCESLSHPCTTIGDSEGNISTTTLEGSLGWEVRSAQTVGLDLYPPSHSGSVLSYRCVGSTESTVTGSVIASISTAKMDTSLSLKLAASKGIQKPTHFEAEEEDVLIASLDGEASEQLGLAASLTMSPGEAVEVNPSA